MKKFGLLLLALVLALGTLGVGYAMWYEDLYIDGTVYTGEVYAYWDLCGCFDIEDKDVGTIDCQIDASDPRILTITVNNGYPCYFGDCEVEYAETGIHWEGGSPSVTNSYVHNCAGTGMIMEGSAGGSLVAMMNTTPFSTVSPLAFGASGPASSWKTRGLRLTTSTWICFRDRSGRR